VLKNKASYLFGHAARYQMADGRILLSSYHPSNQNTNTGKLSREMFLKIFQEARRLADI
jgi:uracil-DNA glycosylase